MKQSSIDVDDEHDGVALMLASNVLTVAVTVDDIYDCVGVGVILPLPKRAGWTRPRMEYELDGSVNVGERRGLRCYRVV